MQEVLDRVRQTIRRHRLAHPSTRVVAAVSGGSDSVALVHLLRALDAAGELRLVGLAHFNHQLRESAGQDERFAVETAASLDNPILVDREDVAARARRDRRSVEDAARAARYEFFERARSHFAADVIALGHTRDDQAETFLLRLTRGAGPKGLAAMYPRNGWIVRPLLDCRRRDLRAWLADRQIAFVEDASNADVTIPRNRVRAELLPLLEGRFNPGIVDVLADEAEMARDTWDWMTSAVADVSAQLVHAADHQRVIDAAGLSVLPIALRRLVVWRAMTDVAGGRSIAFGHVEAVLRLTVEHGDRRIDIPGQQAERIGSRVVLRGRPAGARGRPVPEAAPNLFRYPLSIPGEVALPEAGCVVSAEAGPGQLPDGATLRSGATAIVRGDLCVGAWAVRNRRPGDRFRPVGLNGEKKLQDLFVDRKVARRERDVVPLVVDESDRIVWVAGHGIDEAFRVTDAAQAVLILRLRQA